MPVLELEGYLPVYLDTFVINQDIDFDLFIYNENRKKNVLFSTSGTKFTEANRKVLLSNKVEALYIDEADYKKYLRYIERHLVRIINNERLKSSHKTKFVFDCAHNVMADMFQQPEVGNHAKRSYQLVQNIVLFIASERNPFPGFRKLMEENEALSSHAVNVCLYSIALARRLHITTHRDLTNIGAAALACDIGFLSVPESIRNSRELPQDHEWRSIQDHVEESMTYIRKQPFFTEPIRKIVASHHERLDGSGYPKGLKSHEIPFYAKIIMVADIFDSISTKFPYRETQTGCFYHDRVDILQTLDIMIHDYAGKIDFEILKELILLLKAPS